MIRYSAQEAYQKLKDGNARFSTDCPSGQGRDHSRRCELKQEQHPYAAILTCADSRVSPEIAFDAGLGDLFVVAVAGNVANITSVASLEFAVQHLGVNLIAVMGHEGCGAVAAALEGGPTTQSLERLLALIQPAVETAPERTVNAIARHHAALTAVQLVEKSDVIRDEGNRGELRIVQAYYNLSSGRVDLAELPQQ